MALVAIANAKLDAEVDGNPDKENSEGDRYEVQRTERRCGKGRSCGETDEESGKNGDNDSP